MMRNLTPEEIELTMIVCDKTKSKEEIEKAKQRLIEIDKEIMSEWNGPKA